MRDFRKPAQMLFPCIAYTFYISVHTVKDVAYTEKINKPTLTKKLGL